MLHWNTLAAASGKDSASRAHCLSDANAADGAPHPTDAVAVRVHGRGTACVCGGGATWEVEPLRQAHGTSCCAGLELRGGEGQTDDA